MKRFVGGGWGLGVGGYGLGFGVWSLEVLASFFDDDDAGL